TALPDIAGVAGARSPVGDAPGPARCAAGRPRRSPGRIARETSLELAGAGGRARAVDAEAPELPCGRGCDLDGDSRGTAWHDDRRRGAAGDRGAGWSGCAWPRRLRAL